MVTRFWPGHRFYYGWWIVFASAAIVFMSAGTFFYGFGLLVTPLTEEFGWSRAAVSAAFSLRTEVGGIASPVVGFAVDRLGPRFLMVGGVIVVATGFLLFSQMHALWAFYGSVIVIAIGMSATGGAMPSVVVSRWFRRKRGRALGMMTLGGGSAGVMAIVFALMIDEMGWRNALIVAAVVQLLVATPLALSIRNSPTELGLPVDGIEDPEAEATGARGPTTYTDGITSRQAIRSAVFWQIAIALALGNFATTALIVHQVPFLTESAGMSDGAAAASVTVMTALSLVGRLGMGAAADYVPKRVVMAVALLLVTASLVLFSTIHHAWQVAYALPLFGLGFGGLIPVRSSIQAEYFGMRAFGAIQGMVLTVSTVGGFLGPVLAGWLYDVSDSYRLAFILLAAGPLIGVPLMLSARPPRIEAIAPVDSPA